MKRSYIGLALGALVAVGAALSLPSCGHDQKLVSLEIQPGTFTFLEPGLPDDGDQSRNSTPRLAPTSNLRRRRMSPIRRPGRLMMAWLRCRLPACSLRRRRRAPSTLRWRNYLGKLFRGYGRSVERCDRLRDRNGGQSCRPALPGRQHGGHVERWGRTETGVVTSTPLASE